MIIVFDFGDNGLLVDLVDWHVVVKVDVLITNVVRLDRLIVVQVFYTTNSYVLSLVVLIAQRSAIATIECHLIIG